MSPFIQRALTSQLPVKDLTWHVRDQLTDPRTPADELPLIELATRDSTDMRTDELARVLALAGSRAVYDGFHMYVYLGGESRRFDLDDERSAIAYVRAYLAAMSERDAIGSDPAAASEVN